MEKKQRYPGVSFNRKTKKDSRVSFNRKTKQWFSYMMKGQIKFVATTDSFEEAEGAMKRFERE